MSHKNNTATVTDVVCKMQFPAARAAAEYEYKSQTYYFCNPRCKEKFIADPEHYLQANHPAEPCCCCGDAFEDDWVKVSKRLSSLRNKFFIAALITVLLIILEHTHWLDIYTKRGLQALLAAAAVFGPGWFLLERGAASLKGLKFNMFTLISMGILSAYIYSIYALIFGFTLPESLLDAQGLAKLHFVPAAMITSLVILGQYLEGRASAGAGKAVRSLMELVPPTARKISPCGCVNVVSLEQIKVGDHIRILPHEKIPVDGVVTAGEGGVDESMLTGESLLIPKKVGSHLSAGTQNGSNVLEMQAQAVGRDTLLSGIVDLVRQARNCKLPIQKLADTVSAFFVPAVLAVATLSLLIWGLAVKDWSMALGCFIAVLLAACPCALGLAAPLAVMVGSGCGARNGILIKDPAILEDLRKVDTIMLDKTGTLTENKPEVVKVYIADGVKECDFYLPLIAMEQGSDHPFANAVLNMPQCPEYLDKIPAVTALTALPGQGMRGCINGVDYILGNLEFLQQYNVDVQSFLAEKQLDAVALERSIAALACGDKMLGLLTLSDKIRPDAAAVIAGIKQRNIQLVLLSGDNLPAVRRVALQLGIEEFYGNLSPQQKLEKVKAMQSFGRHVAMVGDGVNDAAALAAADVSIAMGSGTNAALENAQAALLAGNIGKLGALLRLSRAVNDTIKLNLLLAFAYNMLLIPVAAGAFYSLTHWAFSPEVCAIAMSGSCLLVVSNSLRMWHLKLNKKAEPSA